MLKYLMRYATTAALCALMIGQAQAQQVQIITKSYEAENGSHFAVEMTDRNQGYESGPIAIVTVDDGPRTEYQFDCHGHVRVINGGRFVFAPPRSVFAQISRDVCRASGE